MHRPQWQLHPIPIQLHLPGQNEDPYCQRQSDQINQWAQQPSQPLEFVSHEQQTRRFS